MKIKKNYCNMITTYFIVEVPLHFNKSKPHIGSARTSVINTLKVNACPGTYYIIKLL